MNSYEEELQKKLENGQLPDADGLDVNAYQQVFRALKKEPDFELSPGFAESIVARVISKQQSRNSRDYFWFGAGIVFLIMAFIATVMFTGFRLDFGFLSGMSEYAGLAIFGIAFVTVLNWLDKFLIRGKQFQH